MAAKGWIRTIYNKNIRFVTKSNRSLVLVTQPTATKKKLLEFLILCVDQSNGAEIYEVHHAPDRSGLIYGAKFSLSHLTVARIM